MENNCKGCMNYIDESCSFNINPIELCPYSTCLVKSTCIDGCDKLTRFRINQVMGDKAMVEKIYGKQL
jgi:hypothetical protein